MDIDKLIGRVYNAGDRRWLVVCNMIHNNERRKVLEWITRNCILRVTPVGNYGYYCVSEDWVKEELAKLSVLE